MQWQRRGLRCALVIALFALPPASAHSLVGGIAADAGLRLRVASLVRKGSEPEVDYNSETELPLDQLPLIGENLSTFSVTSEAIFALIFIILIAGGPLLIAYSDGELFSTKTSIVQCSLTVLLLVGGIALFTNVILFNSAHFEGQRSLTIVESVYLLSQMITTVGYGDITPALPRGQVVVGFYVLCCLLLIADMVGRVSDKINGRMNRYLSDTAYKAAKHWLTRSEPTPRRRASTEIFDKPTFTCGSMIASSCWLMVLVIVGILFWHLYPGEDKSWMEACYMSIITLSTVGFGAFTATTEAGKVFGAFWMLLGVAALVQFIGSFSEMMMKAKAVERWKPEQVEKDMQETLQKMQDREQAQHTGHLKQGKMDQSEFLMFVAEHLFGASSEHMASIEAAFEELKPIGHGDKRYVSFSALIEKQGSKEDLGTIGEGEEE